MATNEAALIKIMDILKETCLKSFLENEPTINDAICRMELINRMSIIFENNAAKGVLTEVQNDLLNSLVFSLEGYYRQAHMCLRSSLELLLSFLHYYDNYYDFILWKHDCIDMTWTHLINSDQGVLNQKFLNLVYGATLDVDSLKESITVVYHTTSQFVHGKYSYMQTTISDKIEYSQKQIMDYLSISEKVQKIIILLLYIRFHEELQNILDPSDMLEIQRNLKKYEVKKNG